MAKKKEKVKIYRKSKTFGFEFVPDWKGTKVRFRVIIYIDYRFICRVDSSTTTLWTHLFQIAGCLVIIFFYLFYRNSRPVFNANSVDPDQTQHSMESDLSLHCLPFTLFGVS